MTRRTASCGCGDLTATLSGDPVKVSACHCAACQRRTGSAFSVAVFFDRGDLSVEGEQRSCRRLGDSGGLVDFRFCPRCGSTVLWYPEFRPGWVGVAIGCIDDRSLRPSQAVYESERRDWVHLSLG